MGESRSFKIYARLPWWLQNVACTAGAVLLLRQRFGEEYRTAMEFLAKSQWWSHGELVEYQNERLREVVRHAYETVPYYRETFDLLKLKPGDIQTVADLAKLPVLKKETVRNRYADLLSRGWPEKDIVHGRTGGTTGTSLRLAYSRTTQQWQWAIWYRHRGRFGIGHHNSSIDFGGRSVVPMHSLKPPFWRRIPPMHRTYVSVHHMTAANMPILVEYLKKRKVDYYWGYPSALYLVSEYLREHKIQLPHPPRVVITGAETVLPHQRASIEQGLHAELTDQYGASEYCGNISECEKHRYHVDMEFGVVEFLPLEGVAGDQHRIICTALHNPVMPLIRYEIGDCATVSPGKVCPCGRHSDTVERIDGRIESYVLTPDGRQLGRLDFIFKETPNIEEAQLVQEELASLKVIVVRRRAYNSHDEQILLQNLRKYLGNDIRIDLEYCPSIPREANGKFRQIVSKIAGKGFLR